MVRVRFSGDANQQFLFCKLLGVVGGFFFYLLLFAVGEDNAKKTKVMIVNIVMIGDSRVTL